MLPIPSGSTITRPLATREDLSESPKRFWVNFRMADDTAGADRKTTSVASSLG